MCDYWRDELPPIIERLVAEYCVPGKRARFRKELRGVMVRVYGDGASGASVQLIRDLGGQP